MRIALIILAITTLFPRIACTETMSPLPWAEYPDAVYVKHGEMICTGNPLRTASGLL